MSFLGLSLLPNLKLRLVRYIGSKRGRLSRGITAAFGSVYSKEVKEAVKSWDNGRVWFGI